MFEILRIFSEVWQAGQIGNEGRPSLKYYFELQKNIGYKLEDNIFLYMKSQHLLHLFEENNVLENSFHGTFHFFMENFVAGTCLLHYFPVKFSKELTLLLYFHANGRKPIKRLSFSSQFQ